MKVFVTGVTGFIGPRLCEALIEKGYEVHALIRGKSRGKDLEAMGVRLHEGDLMKPDSIRKAMEGCDYAIHSAAFCGVWHKDPAMYFKVNLEGAVNVFEAAKSTGLKRVVFTSSAGTIGPSSGKPVNEDTIRMVNFFNAYESSKYMAEERALQYVNDGFDIVTVLPTRVFGPGHLEKSNGFTFLMHKYLYKSWSFIPGNGSGVGNYVYVDDVVEGHILALEKGVAGEKYLLGGDNASYNEFFGYVRELADPKGRILRIPLWVLMGIARFETWKSNTLKLSPMVTVEWARRYFVDWNVEVEKAKRDLGYKPRSLKQGIAHTIDWMRSEFGS